MEVISLFLSEQKKRTRDMMNELEMMEKIVQSIDKGNMKSENCLEAHCMKSEQRKIKFESNQKRFSNFLLESFWPNQPDKGTITLLDMTNLYFDYAKDSPTRTQIISLCNQSLFLKPIKGQGNRTSGWMWDNNPSKRRKTNKS